MTSASLASPRCERQPLQVVADRLGHGADQHRTERRQRPAEPSGGDPRLVRVRPRRRPAISPSRTCSSATSAPRRRCSTAPIASGARGSPTRGVYTGPQMNGRAPAMHPGTSFREFCCHLQPHPVYRVSALPDPAAARTRPPPPAERHPHHVTPRRYAARLAAFLGLAAITAAYPRAPRQLVRGPSPIRRSRRGRGCRSRRRRRRSTRRRPRRRTPGPVGTASATASPGTPRPATQCAERLDDARQALSKARQRVRDARTRLQQAETPAEITAARHHLRLMRKRSSACRDDLIAAKAATSCPPRRRSTEPPAPWRGRRPGWPRRGPSWTRRASS